MVDQRSHEPSGSDRPGQNEESCPTAVIPVRLETKREEQDRRNRVQYDKQERRLE